MGFNFLSLMTNEVEHLFLWFKAIWKSYFIKFLFRSFDLFKLGCLSFCRQTFCLYFLDIFIFSYVCFNTLSHCVDWFFTINRKINFKENNFNIPFMFNNVVLFSEQCASLWLRPSQSFLEEIIGYCGNYILALKKSIFIISLCTPHNSFLFFEED